MIYEIVCNETGERYIGSTFEPTIARRIAKHRCKTNRCISKQIIGRGNYSYGLLEKVDVETRDELRMCERKWYDKLQNINKRQPYRSFEERKEYYKEHNKEYCEQHKDKKKEYKKEYCEQNKDKLKECYKAYREQNKDKINEYNKAYRDLHKDIKKEYNKEYYECKKLLGEY